MVSRESLLLKSRAFNLSRLPAVTWGIVAEFLVLGGLLIGLSWAIVNMPGPMPLVLVVGIAAIVIWSLYPSSAVYTLAVLCPFGMGYHVMGLTGIEPTDGVLLVALAVATILLLEGKGRADRFGGPLGKFLLAIWFLMVIWNSVTFLLGPVNEGLWRDPVRDVWYLYRGVLRDFLVFPVAVLCLSNRDAARKTLALTVVVSTIVSIHAILLSWKTHEPAMGPFASKNGLAGFLVLILPFNMAMVLLKKEMKPRLLYGCAAFLMFRALWLTTSRGGLVAFMVSLAPFLLLVPLRRLFAAAMAGLVVLLLLIGMKGNILQRPNFQRYLTLSNYSEQHNFQWREEQWRIFMERIAERPWLGTGSEVVEALQHEGRLPTAHNSYLGMTMRAGIPATVAWVVLLVFMMGLSLRFALKMKSVEERIFWVGTAGLVLAWLTHGIVDNVLLMSEAQRVFWLVVAMALIETSRERSALSPQGREAGVSG